MDGYSVYWQREMTDSYSNVVIMLVWLGRRVTIH